MASSGPGMGQEYASFPSPLLSSLCVGWSLVSSVWLLDPALSARQGPEGQWSWVILDLDTFIDSLVLFHISL